MQPPWPDAIQIEGDIDDVFRICNGVYALVDYWDSTSVICDAISHTCYYMDDEYRNLRELEMSQCICPAVDGYTANHRLDGVKLLGRCYSDGVWAILIDEDVNWVVFRRRIQLSKNVDVCLGV